MQFFGIIPARYQSTRLPGKPLAIIGGKTMIERVYTQCLQSTALSSLAVATDDERIYSAVEAFGGKAIMTSAAHLTGTDRCFEAALALGITNANEAVIINIQGDEPFINPIQIDLLARCFDKPNVQIATLVKKTTNRAEVFSPNIAKVVLGNDGRALYFSRSPIPFVRGLDTADWTTKQPYFKHIGIYAYRLSVLEKLVALKQSPLEIAESLEQLRWLENGFVINTEITENESFAVDTAEDLEKANSLV